MKNFKFQISNFKLKKFALYFCALLITYNLLLITSVHADAVIDNGINFLKSKQDSSGRITTGFSAPSQWSAIAFTAQGIDTATIKNPTNSLKDFLLTDIPTGPSSATDWETRILAIVAIGGNPTNFGGTNYVQHLETFYNSNQIGDTCSLNDDIFGVLALISAGSTTNAQIKQDNLNFLISKQDPSDGGFGFSAPGCDWYSTSADMTGAAVQALVAARDNGLTNPGLDEAINKAKNYLMTNQNGDSGFGYYGSSDADTTGWVLMAFNALGMKDSAQATNARNWLISQQSPTDGGFMICNYDANFNCFEYVSNSATTAQAIIGLSGKTWILKIFNPSEVSNPSSTSTPSSVQSNSSNSSTPTPTPTTAVTAYPTPQVINKQTSDIISDSVSEKPTPTPEVLGETTQKEKPDTDEKQLLIKNLTSGFLPLLFGFGLYIVVRFLERRWKKNV